MLAVQTIILNLYIFVQISNQVFMCYLFIMVYCPALVGTDIGRGSEMSPDNDIGMLVVINSSVEYARQPPPEICWT